MTNYSEHFKLDTASAKEYIKFLKIFGNEDELECDEIGDGNINYIFRIKNMTTGKSVVLKQADKFLRSSGRTLDLNRNRIEAEILQLQSQYSPNSIPKIYHYDDVMCAIIMEDISEYKNLRLELMKGKIFPNFANEISSFLVDTLLPTTDLVLDRGEKKERVQRFINKELCDISECLVFTEPYTNDRNRNIIIDENKEYVEKYLYSDLDLHLEVGKLKNNFMNNAQALIHGDLHSGSIFINEKGIKVIDPEFAFYGPMGYDIGNVIGNLFFALVNRKHLMLSENKDEFINWLKDTIKNIFDMFKEKFIKKYDLLVKDSIYINPKFKNWYLNTILSDSIGMAGLEIIRRVVGDSKVLEITAIENIEKRVVIERELIEIGIRLIKNREIIKEGKDLF